MKWINVGLDVCKLGYYVKDLERIFMWFII